MRQGDSSALPEEKSYSVFVFRILFLFDVLSQKKETSQNSSIKSKSEARLKLKQNKNFLGIKDLKFFVCSRLKACLNDSVSYVHLKGTVVNCPFQMYVVVNLFQHFHGFLFSHILLQTSSLSLLLSSIIRLQQLLFLYQPSILTDSVASCNHNAHKSTERKSALCICVSITKNAFVVYLLKSNERLQAFQVCLNLVAEKCRL